MSNKEMDRAQSRAVYDELMSKNPTRLGEVKNSKGQLIEIYEDPDCGDERPVWVVCKELELAAITDYWDPEDFYNGVAVPVFDLSRDEVQYEEALIIEVQVAVKYDETFRITFDDIETYKSDLCKQGYTWGAYLTNEDVAKQIATDSMDRAIVECLEPRDTEVNVV